MAWSDWGATAWFSSSLGVKGLLCLWHGILSYTSGLQGLWASFASGSRCGSAQCHPRSGDLLQVQVDVGASPTGGVWNVRGACVTASTPANIDDSTSRNVPGCRLLTSWDVL